MKHNQRLDYSRLAEVLHERGIADSDSIRELLHQSQAGGTPFAEALVTSNLIGDWDLSRVVCEIFSLPFLPVEFCTPDIDAAKDLNIGFLQENGLVPMGRFGQTLTVCMPALVPADILALLAAESELVILPVVGTVQSNRRWLGDNLTIQSDGKGGESGSWGEMFDDADAAVLMDLNDVEEGDDLEDIQEMEAIADMAIESADDSMEFNLEVDDSDGLEFNVDESENLELLETEILDSSQEPDVAAPGGGDISLPPMPKFGQS